MFNNTINLPFKLLGIPLKLDISFLLVLPLFAWLIGSQIPAYIDLLGLEIDPANFQEGFTPYLLGLIAALGLFVSVVIHELGHAVTAKAFNVKTKDITLWFLGGVAQLEEIPRKRGVEAIIAIVGPITSLLLAGVFELLRQGLAWGAAPLFILSYLAITNIALAVFNLLPALPLDGGRVLRSLLALRLPYLRATRISANISRLIAIILGIFGLLSFNLLLVAIAFFIFIAVQSEATYAFLSETLENLSVSKLMTTEISSVSPSMSIEELLEFMLAKKHLAYPVVDKKLIGIITLRQVRNLDDEGKITEVMLPPSTISVRAGALEALKRLSQPGVDMLIVVDSQEQMLGVVTKTDLLRVIQISGIEKIVSD